MDSDNENIDLLLEHMKSEDLLVYRDFLSIRDTFTREIDQKEEKRLALIDNINLLELKQEENSNKIDLLEKNILIYEKNIEESDTRQLNLNRRENWIKKNYSDIVSGSKSNPHHLENLDSPDSMSDTFYNLFKENVAVHADQPKSKLEELQSQKEKFLETLQNLFEQYDNELVSISKEREQLKKLSEEIENKKKTAFQLKSDLNDNNMVMAEQILKDEESREIITDEEKKLIKEFQKIIQKIKADINVSDITMDILLSTKKTADKEESAEKQ